IYVFRVPLGEVAVPVVSAFIENKTQESYEEVPSAVVAISEANGASSDPTS
ncbi:hypothetical protein HPB47_009684, partial [Ixodes persulcatus]